MNRIAVGSSKVEELSRQNERLEQKPRDTKRLAGILMGERTQFDEA